MNLENLLEMCLQELKRGRDPEIVLARYPGLAEHVRPILVDLIQMEKKQAPGPSLGVLRRARAKLLYRAGEMRRMRKASVRYYTRLTQQLVLAAVLVLMGLVAGTEVVQASSSALPGEQLYPVKRAWEATRLFLAFQHGTHEFLEHLFWSERLSEVEELLTDGRYEKVSFVGIYVETGGSEVVSDICLAISQSTILPTKLLSNGAAVQVTGWTDANGCVVVESIKLLPAGTTIPNAGAWETDEEH